MGKTKDLVCYKKKQSFRQCAWGPRQLVLKPGFRHKRRALGIREKSENFNSLRPILFELCKKNYRNRVNTVQRFNFCGINLLSLFYLVIRIKLIPLGYLLVVIRCSCRDNYDWALRSDIRTFLRKYLSTFFNFFPLNWS